MNRETALTILKKELAVSKIVCDANQIAAAQGDCQELIYYVEKGWTKLSKFSNNGREFSIDICGTGDFIGLPTLFTNHEFPVNITALTPCEILTFSKKPLESFLLRHPQILAVICAELGEVVLKLRGVKIAANQQDGYGQVYDLLAHFATVFGTDIPGGRLIPFNLTQQDIADFIGLSRTRVCICMKSLLKSGYIYRQGRYYAVPS